MLPPLIVSEAEIDEAVRAFRETGNTQLLLNGMVATYPLVQAGKLNAAQAVELAREPEEIQLDERDMLPTSRVRPPVPPTSPMRIPLTTRPMQTSPLSGFLLRHQEIVAALLGAATILILGLLLLHCRG